MRFKDEMRLYTRAFVAVACTISLLIYLQVSVLSKHGHSRDLKRHLHQVASKQSHDVSDTIVRTASTVVQNVTNGTVRVENKPMNSGQKAFMLNYEKALESGIIPPLWQRELYKDILTGQQKTKFYLSHLLMVRLYTADKAKWTIRELKQWLHYMFLAGVEHVYICDHWHNGDGDMERQLRRYITLHLVSYKRTYTHNPMPAQVQCYNNWIQTEGSNSTWMTTVDMDEYPYHLKDKQEKFLQRYLKDVKQRYPDVAEVSMPNFLMLGQGDRSKNITVDRIRRSTPDPANKLVKPIFQPCCVRPDIHRSSVMFHMRTMPADPQELRMLHYWGGRLQNWGPDTDELLKTTIPYNDMADSWVGQIRNSLLSFGEKDAFSHKSGP